MTGSAVSAEASQVGRRPSSGATGASLGEAPTTAVPKPSSAAPSTRARKRRAIDTLAVLPFVNLSGGDELEYLVDGLTESLINNLSQIVKLRIMARGTVYRYKGRDVDPQQVGRELGVKAVLSGRLVQVADRYRIAVELVDAGDGSHIWGSQFTRPPSDLLVVEEEIAGEITDALKVDITPAVRKRLQRPGPATGSAVELYLKGRYFWNKRSQDALQKAADFFERAIADDANFALAHSGLADAYALMARAIPPSKVSIGSTARVQPLRGRSLWTNRWPSRTRRSATSRCASIGNGRRRA